MTIGIGVLASTMPKPHTPRPDSIILVADTMGSTETDSTDDLHKMWLNDELQIYAVGAGTLEYAGEFFVVVENELKAALAAGQPRTHGVISGTLVKAFHILKSQHFGWDIVPHLTVHIHGSLVPQETMVREWQQYCVNTQMLFATFDHTGQAYLYLIGQGYDEQGNVVPKTVHLREFPGYSTIGTGGANADFWLNYRRQVLGLNVKRSAYHAFEAKKMAAKAPTVNDAIELAIVLPGQKAFHLSEEQPMITGCPVSLSELEKLFKKHGPQPTESLKPDVAKTLIMP